MTAGGILGSRGSAWLFVAPALAGAVDTCGSEVLRCWAWLEGVGCDEAAAVAVVLDAADDPRFDLELAVLLDEEAVAAGAGAAAV